MLKPCSEVAWFDSAEFLLSGTGYKEAFAKFSKYRIDSRGIAYDYVSVMHYGDKSFTKNGRPTIEAKRKDIHRLGNTELSELDIKQTNLVYKCDSEYPYSFFKEFRPPRVRYEEPRKCHGRKVLFLRLKRV